MDNLLQSLRFAFRALVKNRLLSLLAVVSLALAIAGNATVFSLVSAMLLRPLPYQNPETLLVDTRNQYEVEVGTFPNALDPGTDSFRQFPKFAAQLAEADRAQPTPPTRALLL